MPIDTAIPPPRADARPHGVRSPNGVRIDEYYWLRDDTRSDPAVLAYLEAENAYADAVMAPLRDLREAIYEEIVGRIKQDDASVPFLRRGYWYNQRHEIGREYPIYARRRTLDGPEEVLLDVNALAAGRDFMQVGRIAVSPDSRLLAWTEDDVGRRQFTIRVRDLQTGALLPDVVENVEPDIAWSADGGTILYVAKDPVTLLGDEVRAHVLGTAVAGDRLVHREDDKSFYTSVSSTKDERYLLIRARSTLSDEVRVARADDPSLVFRVLVPRQRGHEYAAEHLHGRWILRTNLGAKNFRVVEAAGDHPEDVGRWRDIVPHRNDTVLEAFDVFDDFVAVEERASAVSRVRIVPFDGTPSFLIESDEPAFTAKLGDNPQVSATVVRYTYTSLATPLRTYDFDVRTRTRTLLKEEAVLGDFDASRYATEQLWALARDGASVPVSIVYRRDTPLDGTAPLLQYGYGAYGLSMEPAFSGALLSLLDRGFVYAIAHVRGGQELGRAWYEAGRQQQKRNTFTDFIDVTRELVARGYGAPDKVFAMGGSAGGLLMAAITNMAPDLYRGIVAQVPFVDVVTTMLDESIPLTTNEYDEWGNPSRAEDYACMLSYSPYDNVRAQRYPALFVITGLWDSQVQYYEPAKWVARLRARKTDANPVVFRINMEAGHGGKSGRFRKHRERAEQYAFLLYLARG